jgi:hypothetical protein
MTFEKDVLPGIYAILLSPATARVSPQLGLDLRTFAATMRGSHNGPVIVKGSPEQSLLFQKNLCESDASPSIQANDAGRADRDHSEVDADGAVSEKQPLSVKKSLSNELSSRKRFNLLFQAKCVQCHGPGKPMAGLDLRSHGRGTERKLEWSSDRGRVRRTKHTGAAVGQP